MKNPGRTILIILFALLLLSPLDPVPDVIPVIGWTDDLLYIVGIIYQILQIKKDRENTVIEDNTNKSKEA